jgi:TM2 domain-containing membrane protein YozV
MKRRSEKSYTTAVILSGIFGFVGIQHFYLGRWMEGLADVALTVGWCYYFAVDKPLMAVTFLGIDLIHTFVVSILLLVGNFKDGDGAYVCYPGQKLNPKK